MLKLKENVKFEDLKKFGFEYLEETNTLYNKFGTFISTDRVVYISIFSSYVDTIYDLTVAGLIEKVEDTNVKGELIYDESKVVILSKHEED